MDQIRLTLKFTITTSIYRLFVIDPTRSIPLLLQFAVVVVATAKPENWDIESVGSANMIKQGAGSAVRIRTRSKPNKQGFKAKANYKAAVKVYQRKGEVGLG